MGRIRSFFVEWMYATATTRHMKSGCRRCECLFMGSRTLWNVDEYLHLFGRKHDTGWGTYLKKGFKRPNVLLSLNRIAASVKEAEVNLVHLFQAKDRWVSMASGGSSSDNSSYIVERSQHMASMSRSISDEDLVGVDDDRKVVMQWLEDGGLERSVIALHGMGGLGKTALAANVYKKARGKFECHAWVSISQTYSREDVLRNLIEELFKDKVDVPTDIATMGATGLEETLKTLPSDKSWELLCKKAFPRDADHGCPAELKDLSEEIVGKCKGLPLAIVSVGSLLFVREKTVEEWRRINDQLSWEIINNPRLDHVRNVLLLSFIYLPTYLKSCFLYCSLFPEDYPLKRKKLVRLWIAEGFIVKKGESTLEEVAEGYLKELVHRNMLQLIGRNSFGRIKSFRMHDIVRELAVDLCRRECFGVAFEDGKHGRSLEENDERRVVIHKFHEDLHQSVLGVYRLRSIIALDKSMSIPSSTVLLSSVLENSRYMSVLE